MWFRPARSFVTQKSVWWSTYSSPRSHRLNDPMMFSFSPAYTSSEQMNPSVSLNHCTVSRTFGVPSTPCPIRLIGAGGLGSRISTPARRSGSLPVFTGSRATGIGGNVSIPCTTSTWYPFGSRSRTRFPPPGSSIPSTGDAPGAFAARPRSASLAAWYANPTNAGSPFSVTWRWWEGSVPRM